jgi:hypothetical protein
LGSAVAIVGLVSCGGDGPELPVPSQITVVAETNGQIAFAGARVARPLAVTVGTDDGSPVPRAEVRWMVVSGAAATLSDSVTVTDGLGRAEVDVTLGPAQGALTIHATLEVDRRKTASFSVTALEPPRLTEVVPAVFDGGDTIVLRGSLLVDSLPVEVGRSTARVLSMSAANDELTIEVPACLVPGTVSIAIRFPGGSSNELTGTFRAPANGLRLAVGDYVSIDPLVVENCATFPPAGATGAEYLFVPQATTGTPNRVADYELRGDSAGTVTGPPPASPVSLSTAQRFHAFLRGQETEFAELPKPRDGITTAPLVGIDPGIVVGDEREFRVCNTVTCSQAADFTLVTASARYVGKHAAIYLDLNAPDTLTPAAFEEFGTLFDQELYEVATRAFGSESDIDENGLVLILMTPVVNQLTPQSECESSIITGFFFAIDVDPAFRNDQNRSNQGEVFYALTPDPSGDAGCAHSVDLVSRLVPVTFVHEVQHMISYNQHVLVRGGPSEVLWLNEGLSHISEELAALHFGAMGDDTRFTQFAVGNLYDAYLYLENPGATFTLFSVGSGTLAERGAAWLFLRWVIDQHGEAVTRRLLETRNISAANVEAAAGRPFEQLVAEWMLATWVSDLRSFTPPERLKYVTWPRLRFTFDQLHRQIPDRFVRPFPLVPRWFIGGTFAVTGELRSGSGEYILVEQDVGQRGFTLTFNDPLGGNISPTVRPRLTVIRTR